MRSRKPTSTELGVFLLSERFGKPKSLFQNGTEVADAVAKWKSAESNPYWGKKDIATAAINAAIRGNRRLPKSMVGVLSEVLRDRTKEWSALLQAMVLGEFDRAISADMRRLDGPEQEELDSSGHFISKRVLLTYRAFVLEDSVRVNRFSSYILGVIEEAESFVFAEGRPELTLIAASEGEAIHIWRLLLRTGISESRSRGSRRTSAASSRLRALNEMGILRVFVSTNQESVPAVAHETDGDSHRIQAVPEDDTPYPLNRELTFQEGMFAISAYQKFRYGEWSEDFKECKFSDLP